MSVPNYAASTVFSSDTNRYFVQKNNNQCNCKNSAVLNYPSTCYATCVSSSKILYYQIVSFPSDQNQW